MKKKNIIFIFVTLLSLLFNSFVLAEDTEEDREVIDLTSSNAYTLKYYSCTVPDNLKNYVSVTITGGDSTFLKLADPVGDGSDVTYNVSCGPVLNPSQHVQFNLKMKTVSQAEADDDSKYLDYSPSILKSTLFPMYKSCRFANSDDGFIRISNQSTGVFITIVKTRWDLTQTEELNCITQQSKNAKMHLKIPSNAATGSTGINGVGKETTTGNSTDNSYEVPGNCESILGSVDKEGDVAYILQKILNFMKFLGPVLAIAFTIIDLVKTVASNDKDSLNKTLKTTAKRLVYAVLLYIFPVLLNFILGFVSSHGTCGIQ